MYKIYIDEELELDEYKKIINLGISKSDAFMLVTYRHSSEAEEMYSKPDRNVYESEEEFLTFLNYFEQAKKERYDREVIFKNNTEPFLEKLKPYLIKKRNFPTEWPGTKVVFYDKFNTVDICVYRNCNEIRDFLLQPKGLFNWKYPYFPDDLCFFKNGYCRFYTVAHEEFSFMFVESEEEIKKLKKIGFNFRFKECDESDLPLYYEDYKLY